VPKETMDSLFSNGLTPSLETATAANVTIDRGVWIDERRQNRPVAYKIYRPVLDIAETLPVILWSHGLGGSRDGAGFLSRYIASYNYIVVHIQHLGTDSSLWEGKAGHPWDVIKATKIPRRATLQRFQDVPFALDQIIAMNNLSMDLTRIGMCGHSFGALSTQMACGQSRGRGRHLYQVSDDRIKCGIAYSPVTVQKKYNHPPEDFYGTINRPMMYMTGTDDNSPVIPNYTYQKRLEVFEHAGSPNQFLLIKESGDHMVYNGSRGGLGANAKREIHETIICLASLIFWEAFLRNDQNALDILTKGGFKDWLKDNGEFRFR
jgi:predicted dienelactone hydrolase